MNAPNNGRCILKLSALAFTLILLAAFSVAAQREDTITVKTELVNLNVVVLDRQGRTVSGLTKEDFEVFENGKQQEITHFSADERPARTVLLFDTSLSMEAVLPQVKREASGLIDGLRAKDEVSVVAFASEVQALSSWIKPEQAKSVVENIAAEAHAQPVAASVGRNGYRVGDSNTNLYEALQYALANFKAAPGERVAVIVFSDDVDTAAGRGVINIRKRADEVGKEVRRYAQESWALLYPIRYKTEQVVGEMPEPAWRPTRALKIGSRPADPGEKLFAQIAEASGGEVFEWTTQNDLNRAIDGALSDLRSQYGIAYAPPSAGDRTGFRRIKVRLKRPNLVARTREGYFVTR